MAPAALLACSRNTRHCYQVAERRSVQNCSWCNFYLRAPEREAQNERQTEMRLWLSGQRILGGLHIEGIDDLVFCFIWACMMITSICFAFDAYHLGLIKLGTFDFRIPPEYNVNINGIKFQDVIN